MSEETKARKTFAERRKSLNQAKTALRYLKPALALVWEANRAGAVLLFAITLVSACLPISQAYVGRLIVDSVVGSLAQNLGASEAFRVAIRFLVAEFVLIAIGSILTQLRRYSVETLNQQLAQSVGVRLMRKASRLDVFYFETPEFYDKLQTARRETDFRAMAIMNASFFLLQNFITLASFALPIFLLNPWIAIVLLLSTAPTFVAQTRYSKLSFRLNSWRAPEGRKSSYYEHLLTVDASAKEVRLFGLADRVMERHAELFKRIFAEDRKLAARRSAASVLWGLVATSSFYGCYAWTIFITVARQITLGQMTFYLTSFRTLQGTFSGIFDNLNSLYENGLFMQNLFAILDLPERGEGGAGVGTQNDRAAGLEFRNVSFRYPSSEESDGAWALRNVSFHVRPGEKVALVGANGSGKTTLIKLLTRLYEPTEGEIFLYGRSLEDYSEVELRDKIGVIFQDFVRYQLSLQENIGFGAVEHLNDQARLETAARDGGALELVSEFEDGWATMLGGWFQKGRELSGGQWQKIALSRAFMRESEILVLDEPTSALDAAKEHEVFERFKALTEGKIAFLASHRFSTVRMADQILVLDHGRILEHGSHASLMTMKGRYADLFELQAQGYR